MSHASIHTGYTGRGIRKREGAGQISAVPHRNSTDDDLVSWPRNKLLHTQYGDIFPVNQNRNVETWCKIRRFNGVSEAKPTKINKDPIIILIKVLRIIIIIDVIIISSSSSIIRIIMT